MQGGHSSLLLGFRACPWATNTALPNFAYNLRVLMTLTAEDREDMAHVPDILAASLAGMSMGQARGYVPLDIPAMCEASHFAARTCNWA